MKRKQVLILGCSYSLGSYTLDLDHIVNESCDKGHCWYDYLPKEYDYTVYSFPGGGYLNYATLLDNDFDFTKFDYCIIQETWEPRHTLCYPDQSTTLVSQRDNITQYCFDGDKKIFVTALNKNPAMVKLIEKSQGIDISDPNLLEWLYKVGFENGHATTMVRSYIVLINRFLRESNIPTYAFSMSGRHFTIHDHVQYLDVSEKVRDRIWFKDEYQNFSKNFIGHFNHAGMTELGKIVSAEVAKVLK